MGTEALEAMYVGSPLGEHGHCQVLLECLANFAQPYGVRLLTVAACVDTVSSTLASVPGSTLRRIVHNDIADAF